MGCRGGFYCSLPVELLKLGACVGFYAFLGGFDGFAGNFGGFLGVVHLAFHCFLSLPAPVRRGWGRAAVAPTV